MLIQTHSKLKHGTHSFYSKGCRCDECRVAHRIYMRHHTRKVRRHKQGIEYYDTGLIETDEVQDHMRFLQSRGVGLGEIARRTGFNRTNLQRIRRGQQKMIRKENADKILAISAYSLSQYSYVDAGPAKQKIQELIDLGFSRHDLGVMLGNKLGHLEIKNKMRKWRADNIMALHAQLTRTKAVND